MKKLIAILPFLLFITSQQPVLGKTSFTTNHPVDSKAANQDCKLAQLSPQQRPQPVNKPIIFKPPTLKMKVTGGTVKLVSPKQAGLSLRVLPGVKRISFRNWAKLKSVPKSGLYLVETPFVPASLPKQLKKLGYTLKPDGRLLDEKGQPITLFVKSEVFEVKRKPVLRKSISQAAVKSISTNGKLYAANPYPFSQFSWSMWWRYRGGFCRDYRAWTTAEAWGPLQGGARPHTRIQYMETRAQIGSRKDRDSCFNCDNESSYVRRRIGCFWPAHGKGSGSHYANWKDGRFSATRTWSWSH
ncbi:MAG: hypothetical protein QNJ34_20610 [Xenococcaceae cyanobacterium MO_188.B29]|nr:hypothetical protein [Xenococcaceae cyanobacterium MO_188.B29]